MGIQPLHNNVLLLPLSVETVTAGGVLIPDSAKERPFRAKVMAVAPGRYEDGKLIPLQVRVDDIVLFDKWASRTEVRVNDVELIVMPETSVLGIETP